MAQMVGLEYTFKPVNGGAELGAPTHTCIVHQGGEGAPSKPLLQCCDIGAHRGQRGEIQGGREDNKLGTWVRGAGCDLICDCTCAPRVAAGEDDEGGRVGGP